MKKDESLLTHPSRLLSVDEVAVLYGVSPKTIRRYHSRHLLPEPIRLANRHLLKWRLGDIAKFIDRQFEVQS